MLVVLEKLKNKIESYFPQGNVTVVSDDDVHFRVVVTDAVFKGLSKIEQHRMVYDAVGDMMQGECHALQIETNEELA